MADTLRQVSKKPAPKPDDPEQSKRFIETAKEVEAANDPTALEEALTRIAMVKPPRPG